MAGPDVAPGRVRVKQLSVTFDPDGDQQVMEAPRIVDDQENPGDFMAPATIYAQELDLELGDVVRKLRAHDLTRDDLINDGSGWMSIGDYPPLEEVVAAIRPSVHERLERVGLDKRAGWTKLIFVLISLAMLGWWAWAALGESMRVRPPTDFNDADWGVPPGAGPPAQSPDARPEAPDPP